MMTLYILLALLSAFLAPLIFDDAPILRTKKRGAAGPSGGYLRTPEQVAQDIRDYAIERGYTPEELEESRAISATWES